jgi:cytochrome c oxidase cbb3-type subunit 3
VAVAEEKYRAMRDQYLAMPIEEVAADPKARKMGMRIYGNNCSQCHGLDAAGALGFPNLADSDWLWGGSPDAIKHTIVNGRRAAMPAWEAGAWARTGFDEATAYILSLNSRDADPVQGRGRREALPDLLRGLPRPRRQGQPDAMGAPNLTNGIWLYGGTQEQMTAHPA